MYANDLRILLENPGAKVLMIDVREPDELESEPYFEQLPENYLVLPLGILKALPQEELSQRLHEKIESLGLKPDEMTFVALCHSGRRSEMACEYLRSLGFRAENLEGGVIAWKSSEDK